MDFSSQHFKELTENGITIIKNAIAAAEVDRLVQEIEEFKKNNPNPWSYAVGPDGLARRIVNLHLAIPSLSESIGSCKPLCRLASMFFNGTPRIYTSLFFEGGSEQAIHRDTPYFATEPEGRFLGIWLALEDADTSNGALEVIKGGHLAGEPDRASILRRFFDDPFQVPKIDDRLWAEYQNAVIQLCASKGLERETVCVHSGDIIIWHPDLPHGGSQITEPGASRKSIVFHVTPRECPVYQMEVFFNPKCDRQATSSWDEHPILPSQNSLQEEEEASMFVAKTSDEISFAHVHNTKISDLISTSLAN
jgi:ectoine hydroxylase-related dioxygenase (phytanoyl-CoA dioxygenase family)